MEYYGGVGGTQNGSGMIEKVDKEVQVDLEDLDWDFTLVGAKPKKTKVNGKKKNKK